MPAVVGPFAGPEYYDRCLGEILFEPFAAELAQRLPERFRGDVLEVACGTGVVTRRLRERIPEASRLVATDLSKPMLDYARAALSNRAGIEWLEADAVRLPFPDAAFAALACGFGLMFVTDRLAALREARRVLGSGGMLLFTVWDRIEENPHALANAETIESLFPDDPAMRFRIPYEMADPAQVRELLAAAGFDVVRIDASRIALKDVDPVRIATGQMRGTPRAAQIESRGVSLDAVIGKVVERLIARGGDPYCGPAQALVVVARAP